MWTRDGPRMTDGVQSCMSRLDIANELQVGDMVKVVDGPFANMFGKITSINLEKQQVEVALDLFGQETNVELELTQIAKS